MTDLAQPGSTASTAAEQAIRAVLAEKDNAINTQDAERLVALYAPGTVVFDLAPPLQHEAAEVLDPGPKQEWFAGFEQMHSEVHDLHISVGGEVAFAFALVEWTATPKGESEEFTMWFRSTVGLTRVDGSWLISHEHESTPFYMDGSFRAATDLQPVARP